MTQLLNAPAIVGVCLSLALPTTSTAQDLATCLPIEEEANYPCLIDGLPVTDEAQRRIIEESAAGVSGTIEQDALDDPEETVEAQARQDAQARAAADAQAEQDAHKD